MKCHKCNLEAAELVGRCKPACAMHHRFMRMRQTAAARKLSVPTFAHLEELASKIIAGQMLCPHCKRAMKWKSGGSAGAIRGTTVSLQHDRSGQFRLICVSCNKSHSVHPGDSFYQVPFDHKQCGKCRVVKPHAEFGRNRRLFKGIQQYCRACKKHIDSFRSKGKRCV